MTIVKMRRVDGKVSLRRFKSKMQFMNYLNDRFIQAAVKNKVIGWGGGGFEAHITYRDGTKETYKVLK